MTGWHEFWKTYRACLRQKGIDTTVPERLPELLADIDAFETIIVQDGNIPVGFWPEGYSLLLFYFFYILCYLHVDVST